MEIRIDLLLIAACALGVIGLIAIGGNVLLRTSEPTHCPPAGVKWTSGPYVLCYTEAKPAPH